METVILPIFDTEGKEVEKLELNNLVFDGTINKDAIYQAVVSYRANQRPGLASTKTRGEVSGGGRKPWRQKGTGRARAGSTRSPLWRHGGVVFGPHPRDFSYNIPKKIRLLALKSALNSKVKENNFLILDALRAASKKTKDMSAVLLNLNLMGKNNKKKQKMLFLLDKLDENLKMSLRNLRFVNVNLAKDTHAYEVMCAKKLVITKGALAQLIKRFER